MNIDFLCLGLRLKDVQNELENLIDVEHIFDKVESTSSHLLQVKQVLDKSLHEVNLA